MCSLPYSDVTDSKVKDWETLDGKSPSLVGYVYNRLVSFQVRSVCVDGLSGGVVLVLKPRHDSKFFKTRQYRTRWKIKLTSHRDQQ